MKGIVKGVLIGAVPDRGGRANEMRPTKADINPYGGHRGGGGGGESHLELMILLLFYRCRWHISI
jgi:hypothetical protein